MNAPLRLHLGCGQHSMPGWLNCDHRPAPHVDRVFDLQARWPFETDSTRDIYASHTLEHLQDHRAFFREAWRVLMPGRPLVLRVPFGSHRSAMADPDHVRPWWPESFAWLQPGYGQTIGNLDHMAWDAPFLLCQCLLRVSARLAWRLRSWPVRRFAQDWLRQRPDAVEELWVTLTPVKDLAKWQPPEGYDPQMIYGTYVMQEHDYLKQPSPLGNAGLRLLDCTTLAPVAIGGLVL